MSPPGTPSIHANKYFMALFPLRRVRFQKGYSVSEYLTGFFALV